MAIRRSEGGSCVVLSIGRLDTCNGIAMYFSQLACYFRSHGAPLDVLIGNLVHYRGAEGILRSLMDCVHRAVVLCTNEGPPTFLRHIRFLTACIGHCRLYGGRNLLFYVHSFDALIVTSVLACLLGRLRVVHAFQVTPRKSYRVLVRLLFGKWALWRNQRVSFIAISTEIENVLAEAGVPQGQISRISHGVDTETFRPPSDQEKTSARWKHSIPHETFCITVVARLDPVKGYDLLFRALAQIPNSAQDFTVMCIGAGDQTWLRNLARLCGWAGTPRTPGQQPSREFLWAADLFVLASHREGFPIASLEAMACGLPVIRTDVGGAHDQLEDGISGFVVAPDNATELAGRIRDLAADATLRKRLGQAARTRVTKFFELNQLLEKTRDLFAKSLSD